MHSLIYIACTKRRKCFAGNVFCYDRVACSICGHEKGVVRSFAEVMSMKMLFANKICHPRLGSAFWGRQYVATAADHSVTALYLKYSIKIVLVVNEKACMICEKTTMYTLLF